MTQAVDDAKSCDPQLLDIEAPSHAWPLKRLTAAVQEAHAAILAEERSTTSRYWQLGQLLHLARQQFAHGHWNCYLKELGIEKTRAVKAMRIFETFATAAQTQGLTVAEAYAKRKRRPRAAKSQRAHVTEAHEPSTLPGETKRTWSQFAAAIVAEVDCQQDEVELMAAVDIRRALAEVDRAVTALRRLEERLQRRDYELNDPAAAKAVS